MAEGAFVDPRADGVEGERGKVEDGKQQLVLGFRGGACERVDN